MNFDEHFQRLTKISMSENARLRESYDADDRIRDAQWKSASKKIEATLASAVSILQENEIPSWPVISYDPSIPIRRFGAGPYAKSQIVGNCWETNISGPKIYSWGSYGDLGKAVTLYSLNKSDGYPSEEVRKRNLGIDKLESLYRKMNVPPRSTSFLIDARQHSWRPDSMDDFLGIDPANWGNQESFDTPHGHGYTELLKARISQQLPTFGALPNGQPALISGNIWGIRGAESTYVFFVLFETHIAQLVHEIIQGGSP